MSHLRVPEMQERLDGMYACLLGGDGVYEKWRELKERVHIVSETMFIEWMLDFITQRLEHEHTIASHAVQLSAAAEAAATAHAVATSNKRKKQCVAENPAPTSNDQSRVAIASSEQEVIVHTLHPTITMQDSNDSILHPKKTQLVGIYDESARGDTNSEREVSTGGNGYQEFKMENLTVVLRNEGSGSNIGMQEVDEQQVVLTNQQPLANTYFLQAPVSPSITDKHFISPTDDDDMLQRELRQHLECITVAHNEDNEEGVTEDLDPIFNFLSSDSQMINATTVAPVPASDNTTADDDEEDDTSSVASNKKFRRLTKFSPELLQYNVRCDKCFALFRKIEDLEYHIKYSHSAGQNSKYRFDASSGMFMCRHCEASYSCKQEVTHHEKESHWEKSASGEVYPCEICGKELKSASSKHRHITSIHHMVKYECDACHLVFGDVSDRRRHMVNKHKILEYSCKVCQAKFKRLNHLIKHTKTEHGTYYLNLAPPATAGTSAGQIVHLLPPQDETAAAPPVTTTIPIDDGIEVHLTTSQATHFFKFPPPAGT